MDRKRLEVVSGAMQARAWRLLCAGDKSASSRSALYRH